MNEIICIITLLLSFTFVILSYKFFGKFGLFLWISISTIIANIEAVKLIEIFGIETSLGTVLYGSTFLATDILNLKYGEKETRKTIIIGFLSMIMISIFMFFCISYIPSSSDFAQDSLKTIFSVNVRITLGSIIAFMISQFLDTIIFQKLHKKYNKLWLSNNVSTIICQIVDTIIFCTITYYGLISNKSLIEIMLSMYIFKFIIALLDTPFIYIADKLKNIREY